MDRWYWKDSEGEEWRRDGEGATGGGSGGAPATSVLQLTMRHKAGGTADGAARGVASGATSGAAAPAAAIRAAPSWRRPPPSVSGAAGVCFLGVSEPGKLMISTERVL